MTLLITVPHNCVISRNIDTGCDENAKRFGEDIGTAINMPSTLILGDTPRRVCDLNRLACRNCNMRQNVTSHMHHPENIALIDIHTFPYGQFPVPYGRTLWFVVLSGEERSSAMKLYLQLQREGFGEYVQFGMSPLNDIVEESNTIGLPAALLEIRDDLMQSKHYHLIINKVAHAIEMWVREN